MSASSKKKLRAAEESAKLTERQIAEQKEAKKLKFYTVTFVVVLVLLLAIAVTVGIVQTVANSGVRERNTVAMSLQSADGSQNVEISSEEMAYFYANFVQNYANNNTYLSYMLDTTQPLNTQSYLGDPEMTWADYFLAETQKNVQSVYAMSNAAAAAGFVLPETEQQNIEMNITTIEFYAQMSGMTTEQYLKSMYGNGATVEGYTAYMERSALASAYYQAYSDGLIYDDAALRAAEGEDFNRYSSFTYHSYQVRTTQFLEGGTTAEDGTVTYTDEENAAAAQAMEAAVQQLTPAEGFASAAEFDAVLAGVVPGAPTSTLSENQLPASISEDVAQWLMGDRSEGDITAIPVNSTGEDGEMTVIGYNVLYFISKNDNTMPLVNVRHILIAPEHVHVEGETHAEGETYTEEELAAAKAEAEALLAQWEAGDKTEESFAALATEHSTDTGSSANGGLYEDVYPDQMVAAFNDWCFDDSRKAGDTGIVETNYGFHIMFFCGQGDMTYRDYMITNELKTQDLTAWNETVVASYTVVPGDSKYLPLDMTLSSGSY